MSFYYELDKKERIKKSLEIVDIVNKAKNIYFIGIGGIGLSALAQLFSKIGKKVSGSDLYENETLSILVKEGIKIYVGHNLTNIDSTINLYGKIDLAIYSPAVNEENIEYLYFKKNNIPTLTYGMALSYFINSFNSISICGTHGKSSTTAILAEMLLNNKIPTSFLCGAILNKFGTNAFFSDNSKYFIAESCEYKETFLNFFPNNVIIPSLEVDHLDYYKNEENYFNAFKTFIEQIKGGILILRIEKDLEKRLYLYAKRLKNIEKIITYSDYDIEIFDDFENQIHFYYLYDEKNPFEVRFEKSLINGKKENIKKYDKNHHKNEVRKDNHIKKEILLTKTFKIPIPSKEYAANFTSVIAFLEISGILNEININYTDKYSGIKRRFELIGIDKNNNHIISDYAHHPSEIKTLLKISRLKYPDNKIFLIFQAHQHSRTKYLLDQFLSLFKNVENLIILPIYKQRDSEEDIKNMPSYFFYENVLKVNKNALYFEDNKNLYSFLQNNKNCIYLFTGAGTIDGFAKEYHKLASDK